VVVRLSRLRAHQAVVGSVTEWDSIWVAFGLLIGAAWWRDRRRLERRLRAVEQLATKTCDAMARVGVTVGQMIIERDEDRRRRN
jgi:hypothetical protein